MDQVMLAYWYWILKFWENETDRIVILRVIDRLVDG